MYWCLVQQKTLQTLQGSAINKISNIPQCTLPPQLVCQTLLFDFLRVWFRDYGGAAARAGRVNAIQSGGCYPQGPNATPYHLHTFYLSSKICLLSNIQQARCCQSSKFMQQDLADKDEALWVSCINNLLVHNENGKLQDACIHVHICIYKLAVIQSFKWVKCVYINSVQAF